MSEPYLEQKEGIFDRIWTVPNALSALRILMLVPMILCLLEKTPEGYSWAFALIMVGYLTDSLDGFIARHFNQKSKFGMILDPAGDKIVTIGLTLTLYFTGILPLYFMLFIVARDVIIGLGAVYALHKKDVITLPILIGKLNTLVLGTVLAVYPLVYSELAEALPWLKNASLFVVKWGTLLACATILASLAAYAVKYLSNIKKNDAK